MTDPLLWHRLQFAFTLIYHYLFPQLTMGLALLIVVLKLAAVRGGADGWNEAARFWIRIFGINFAVGVVTGVPMEFQFGTNWAASPDTPAASSATRWRWRGCLPSSWNRPFWVSSSSASGALVAGGHLAAAVALFAGSWLSGYFIICTNAFMQHPVGYAVGEGGALYLQDFWALLLNPWAIAQYAHTMVAAVVTASFVMAAVGAYYALQQIHVEHARRFLRVGVTAGLMSSVLVAFPTGDRQAKLVARYQPVSLAAMEGRFESGRMAGIVLIGQPNLKEKRLDNPDRSCRASSAFSPTGPSTPTSPGWTPFRKRRGRTTSSCCITRST